MTGGKLSTPPLRRLPDVQREVKAPPLQPLRPRYRATPQEILAAPFVLARDFPILGLPAMANSTRLRWEALGRFPQRVKFSARYTGYRTQDILAWMAACERRSAEESNEQRQRILEQEAARARQKRWK
jgi:predicted DNA-binding transcriptional regulator AlpA